MSKRKLLLADDSVTIQKVVNLTFADEGIEVIAVGDGDSAIDKFLEISPDLVMADVNMPGLNGYQVCEKIRQEMTNHTTPVILLVGSFEPFDEEEARRVGADDYLTKPFQSIRQLVNKVTVLLNSSAEGDTAKLPPPTSEVSNFADTLEMEKSTLETEAPIQYTDTGYDDEMIQTSSVSGYVLDESQKFETKSANESEVDYSTVTQPLTAQDIKDFDLINSVSSDTEEEVEETTETVSEEVSQTSEIVADDEAESETVIEDTAEETEAVTEETAEETETVIEEPIEETENVVEDTVSEEGTIEEAEHTAEEKIIEAENEVEETVAEATSSSEAEEEMPMPEVADVLQLDEANPLELPPIEMDGDTTAETEEVSSLVSVPTSAPASDITPDLIDAIVQKVLERLSEKTIKDIAWEVVPEVTERIVKKMAEENLKK